MAPTFRFTHVALPVADLDRSIRYYEQMAGMHVVERIEDSTGGNAVRLSTKGHDGFNLMLIESPMQMPVILNGIGHLGVACSAPKEINQLAERAEGSGFLQSGPGNAEFPGYFAMLVDPDGHQLEIYHDPLA